MRYIWRIATPGQMAAATGNDFSPEQIRPRLGQWHDLFVLHEHVGPGPVDQFRRHLVGDALEIADRDHLVDQEDRLIVRIDVVDGRDI